MAQAPVLQRSDRFSIDPETVRILILLVGIEALLVGVYVLTANVEITDPTMFVYPFVWIDASMLALLTTDPPQGSTRQRVVGGIIAGGYFLLLAYFGGLFGAGSGGVAFHVNWGLPPGYGPAVLYNGSSLMLVLEPFKVIGYVTLAYFVYATMLDAVAGAISGLIGLFSCVSCTWPILATIASSIFGSGSAVAAFALSQSYALGTVVFLSALALLYYRPSF